MPEPIAAIAGRLLGHLRGRQEEMVEFLRALVLAESPTHAPESQDAVFSRLAQGLAAAGYRVRRLRGRRSGGQLWAVPRRRSRQGTSRRMQLLLGHSDTVWPAGTLATMPVELRDGRLTGPGVYDMKAGLTQGVFALRALHDLGLEPPVTPAVFVNSDEEAASPESTPRIRRLARYAERVFVLEPSLGPDGRLKTGRKGIAQYGVVARGRAAHAGLEPEKGASAILEIAHVVQQLHALCDPARGITVNVGLISGGLRRNVVAPEARGEVDVRVLRHEDAAQIDRAIRALAPSTPGTNLEITGGMVKPPLEPNFRNRALAQAAVRYAAELGFELGEGTAGGASDGNTTSQYAPTLDGLGAVGDGAHAVHEYVEVARLPERAALLALLLMEPAGIAGA
jgi:glutamate carboxypeptidase